MLAIAGFIVGIVGFGYGFKTNNDAQHPSRSDASELSTGGQTISTAYQCKDGKVWVGECLEKDSAGNCVTRSAVRGSCEDQGMVLQDVKGGETGQSICTGSGGRWYGSCLEKDSAGNCVTKSVMTGSCGYGSESDHLVLVYFRNGKIDPGTPPLAR